jgi:hypothetical protein
MVGSGAVIKIKMVKTKEIINNIKYFKRYLAIDSTNSFRWKELNKKDRREI